MAENAPLLRRSGKGQVGIMPLYMDHHKNLEGLTAEAVHIQKPE
jgi:hypothetical protein